MAAKIVSAYVGKNLVSTGELTDLIHQVYGALQRTMGPDGTRVVGPPLPCQSRNRCLPITSFVSKMGCAFAL